MLLTLDYRCCTQNAPLYLKHAEVEDLALQARSQLVDASVDALPLELLTQIDALRINGIRFDLWVDTEHAICDEHGEPVLGICEFDPGAAPDATLLSVAPAGDLASPELVLSTFAHELGHAVFDAPGWMAIHRLGPGLFDACDDFACKAYRTTTRDAEHLAAAGAGEPAQVADRLSSSQRTVYFAELRANEFMGSLLVPRQHLTQAARAWASHFGVTLHTAPSLFPAENASAAFRRRSAPDLEGLQKALALRFGVHRRFIEVRMARYGLLPAHPPLTL